jgi:hypothetical protein
MLDDIERRLPNSGCSIKMYAYGVILHPCYRGTILSEFHLTKITVDDLISENEVLVNEPGENLDEAMVVDDDDDDDEEAFLRAYTQKGRRASEELPASESILTPQSPLQAEVSKYFARSENSYCPISIDVLDWWKENQKFYPLLAKCAKKYLALQATSCSSERTFSTGGNTVTCSRTKLDPTNVHMLVYCKDNLTKVSIQKLKVEDEDEKAAEEEEEADADAEAGSD